MSGNMKSVKGLCKSLREGLSPVLKSVGNYDDRRKQKRVDVEIDAVLIYEDKRIPITILDLSRGGMKIVRNGMKSECIRFVKGQEVKLLCEPHPEIEAKIVWTVWERAGVQFLDLLPEDHPLLQGLGA